MRLDRSFFERDVLLVSPDLIGKKLVRSTHEGTFTFTITETEAYGGTEDQASHARFGKTSRNSVMFGQGGLMYVYFIYGMYWMMNIVTGKTGNPQAVLIRGVDNTFGPGRVARLLGIDRSFYGEDLVTSGKIWIEDQNLVPGIIRQPRFGINYAGEPWKSNPWRYIMVPAQQNS